MTLRVLTARMGSRDPDWLDVTAGGNAKRITPDNPGGHRGVGAYFAPSAGLLAPYLAKRAGGKLAPGDWRAYSDAYTAEMRRSYREHRAAWDMVLGWERVVLLCFCTDPNRCHRTLLAKILGKLGAEWTRHICARDHVENIDDEMRRIRCVCSRSWLEIGPLAFNGREDGRGAARVRAADVRRGGELMRAEQPTIPDRGERDTLPAPEPASTTIDIVTGTRLARVTFRYNESADAIAKRVAAEIVKQRRNT